MCSKKKGRTSMRKNCFINLLTSTNVYIHKTSELMPQLVLQSLSDFPKMVTDIGIMPCFLQRTKGPLNLFYELTNFKFLNIKTSPLEFMYNVAINYFISTNLLN